MDAVLQLPTTTKSRGAIVHQAVSGAHKSSPEIIYDEVQDVPLPRMRAESDDTRHAQREVCTRTAAVSSTGPSRARFRNIRNYHQPILLAICGIALAAISA